MNGHNKQIACHYNGDQTARTASNVPKMAKPYRESIGPMRTYGLHIIWDPYEDHRESIKEFHMGGRAMQERTI